MSGENLNIPPEKDRQWLLIENLVGGILVEQRRSRRWGIFFKLLTFFYLFLFLVYVIAMAANMNISKAAKGSEYTAVINVNGVIAADEQASADNIVTGLRAAFEDKKAKAVVLRINSPGGSPVQSGYVYDEIKRLRELHPEKKVYAVIADLGASGAYYIASAADEIYADKASLVGSIGVVASGFGFVEAIDKVGVTRRVYTAGQHKGFLDPFLPPKEDETEFWQDVLNTTHQQFIGSVKKGRGERLKDDPKLFSGLVWSGEQAVTLGLVDGLGSTSYVAREVIGVEELIDFTPQENPLERFAKQLGTSIGSGLSQSLGVNNTIKLQ
ncbi:signal peptide peptidase SppA [Endozoicomonas sp. SM1973]|uniref:Signal peptide peptidase SppA n=1 Tax=Spartinivicinus marinus TaxID=2994442 RepID=A0A853I719_9GAMM|nr:signal peptide peptidase SppA [Spartinivicinus marinus]MCX4029431.1 signal peptide peptidase SppA [Spartinivicinus marinus]NYZ65005.1 signal peptide peptidase SppA [Spartinivicinus marinus]